MMAEHEDFFLPGQVEEQIEQLLHEGGPARREQRLTRSLPNLMRDHEDQQSLQRVLSKLHSNLNATTSQETNVVPLPQQRQQRGINAGNAPAGRKPKTLPRAFTLLAACLVLVAVVGSLLLVLNAAQQKRNASSNTATTSTTPAPQKTALNEPLGKVVYRSDFYDNVYGLQWSPNGQRLAGILNTNNNITLASWDAKTGAHKLTYTILPGETNVSSVAWSPDGKYLMVSGSSKIYIFNASQTTQEIRSLPVPSGTASTASHVMSSVTTRGTFFSSQVSLSGQFYFDKAIWSPDSQYIAASYHAEGARNELFVWKAADGSLVKTLNNFPDNITDISWSPDGGSLATLAYPYSKDGTPTTASIWNTSTWEKIREYPAINNLSWSPNGKQIAIADADPSTGLGKAIRIVDAHSGQTIKQLISEKNIFAINWSPDGSRIEVELQNTHNDIQILDATSGSPLHTFAEHGYNGAWSPNGKYIVCSQSVDVVDANKHHYTKVRLLVWVAK